MRFIDSSVFLYAFLKTKTPLPPDIAEVKERAKAVINRVNLGEEVATSTAHISEIANIIEAKSGIDVAIKVVETILSKQNIVVYSVDQYDYLESIDIARAHNIGLNDALALVYMKRLGITEIYSFDKDFDKIPGIKRITS